METWILYVNVHKIEQFEEIFEPEKSTIYVTYALVTLFRISQTSTVSILLLKATLPAKW
jgi:hypothetical protein